MKTTVRTILVLPYSPTLWAYYINEGERHILNAEKLTKTINPFVPELALEIYKKMQRLEPFLLNIEEKSIIAIGPDPLEEKNLKKIDRKPLLTKSLEKPILKNSILGQKEKEVLISKFFRN